MLLVLLVSLWETSLEFHAWSSAHIITLKYCLALISVVVTSYQLTFSWFRLCGSAVGGDSNHAAKPFIPSYLLSADCGSTGVVQVKPFSLFTRSSPAFHWELFFDTVTDMPINQCTLLLY